MGRVSGTKKTSMKQKKKRKCHENWKNRKTKSDKATVFIKGEYHKTLKESRPEQLFSAVYSSWRTDSGVIFSFSQSNMAESEEYARVISFNNDHDELIIYQETVTDVGGVIWDSALMTIHYFFKYPKPFEGKKVLELGSGTGVGGIALAALGADVIITDLPERLALIEKNVEANRKLTGNRIKVQVLDWTKDRIPEGLDMVLAIDCVYYNSTIDPLITLLNDCDAKEIMVVSEERDIGEAHLAQKSFFKDIQKFFRLELIPQKELDEDYCADDIIIGKLIRNV